MLKVLILVFIFTLQLDTDSLKMTRSNWQYCVMCLFPLKRRLWFLCLWCLDRKKPNVKTVVSQTKNTLVVLRNRFLLHNVYRLITEICVCVCVCVCVYTRWACQVSVARRWWRASVASLFVSHSGYLKHLADEPWEHNVLQPANWWITMIQMIIVDDLKASEEGTR